MDGEKATLNHTFKNKVLLLSKMKYQLFLACERGTTPYVQAELHHKGFPRATKTSSTTIIVDGCTAEELVKAAYTLQTPTRVGMLLGEIPISLDLEESVITLETLIGTLDLKQLFPEGKTYLVDCNREGNHEYNSVDLSQTTGRMFKRYAKESLSFIPEVDLKKPDILFYLHVDNEEAWFALDLLGYEADKRPYKIFNNPHSMKGATATCLLMAAGWQPGKIVLDPYASGGEIPIEAALFATGRSVHYYEKTLSCKKHPLFTDAFTSVTAQADKSLKVVEAKTINCFDAQLRNVTAAKKNAKIAGVEKSITFSKLDVDWIETKITEKSVDCIVSHPVEASKHIPREKAMELHKQLFYQADYILTKGGSLTFLCSKPEDLQVAGEQHGFIVDDQKQIFTGKVSRWFIRFVRK